MLSIEEFNLSGRKPLFIFGLDGTLSLADHRSHILQNGRGDAKWRAFYAACGKDEPNVPVLLTLQSLSDAYCDIWIWTGRSDEVRGITEQWLLDHSVFNRRQLAEVLTMRPQHDHRPDVDLKREWLQAMLPEDRERLVCVFEDRARVVSMWREAGVACYQVAPGEF